MLNNKEEDFIIIDKPKISNIEDKNNNLNDNEPEGLQINNQNSIKSNIKEENNNNLNDNEPEGLQINNQNSIKSNIKKEKFNNEFYKNNLENTEKEITNSNIENGDQNNIYIKKEDNWIPNICLKIPFSSSITIIKQNWKVLFLSFMIVSGGYMIFKLSGTNQIIDNDKNQIIEVYNSLQLSGNEQVTSYYKAKNQKLNLAACYDMFYKSN